MSLSGSVAIVTGAGGRIGGAIARKLAEDGADVVVGDLVPGHLDEVVRDISAMGRTAVSAHVDVTKKAEVQGLVDTAVSEFGRLDIMVNNAGVGHVRLLLEMSEEEWDRVMAVNVKGVLFGIQAAAQHMIDHGVAGRIINMSSVAGKGGRPLLAAYAASKAAIINLTQSAAVAFAPNQITVNAICPGVIDTPMGPGTLAQMQEIADAGKAPPEHARVPPAPLGPMGQPEDVAEVARFLASDGAAYLTGQAINICGGRKMD